MDPTATRELGRTGVALTQLGFGGAPLGELFAKVSEADAEATLAAAWAAGIRYYDTAPWYGRGQSEHRTGRFLYRQKRQDLVLSSHNGDHVHAARGPAVPWASFFPETNVRTYVRGSAECSSSCRALFVVERLSRGPRPPGPPGPGRWRRARRVSAPGRLGAARR